MFSYENTVTGKMDIKRLWDLYSNINNWVKWDSSIQKVELSGTFSNGATGTMFLNGMPPLPFVLEDVESESKFSTTSILGNITATFGHFIDTKSNGDVTIMHTVTLSGASDEQLQGMGQGIVSNLPQSMEKLCQLAKADI